MKNKANDLTGQKFGRLTVLERDYSRKGKNSYWICQCDCGNITSVQSTHLKHGDTQSCGCLNRERVSKAKLIDLTGQKFNRLTVLKRDFSKTGHSVYWICQCDCGNVVSVQGNHLKNGNVQSCGCLSKERSLEINTIDLMNQKFNHLTVLERDTTKTGKGAYWICQCDCGNTVSVSGRNLRNGSVQSCGCIKFSKGENKIKDILSSLNINFFQQKTFNNLKHKSNLKFDFFLPDYNCCIEYNGVQHYEPVKYFGGEKEFKEIQLRDSIKKQWCQENNIKLIEIPYWDFDKIDKNYLEQLVK